MGKKKTMEKKKKKMGVRSSSSAPSDPHDPIASTFVNDFS